VAVGHEQASVAQAQQALAAGGAGLEGEPGLGHAVGLGGRDVPLDIYPRLLQTVRSQPPGPFALFDVDLGRLPAEDR
jgi:hypothetical protein